jgi:hypothetical protein
MQGTMSGNSGTHLGAAPDGLDDDEVRDLAEPGNVLRPRKDAGTEHRDLRQPRAVRRHAVRLDSLAPPSAHCQGSEGAQLQRSLQDQI